MIQELAVFAKNADANQNIKNEEMNLKGDFIMTNKQVVKVLCMGCGAFLYFKDENGDLIQSPEKEATMISHGICENCMEIRDRIKMIKKEEEKLGVLGGA